MKYFTKEELEDITKELMENPTRETLNKLNTKYNGSSESLALQTEIPTIQTTPTVEEVPVVEEAIIRTNENVINPISNESVPSMEMPKPENNTIVSELPSFELPNLNIQTLEEQNNKPIEFTGNIFDTGVQMGNLMQTTDNFNNIPNTMPNTEVSVTGTPFFGPHIAVDNNPIPVSGPANNIPNNGPSMFGQIEQNYM